MAVFNLYSKRKKRALGEVTDVFVYDDMPDALRRQIVFIWQDAIGIPDRYVLDIGAVYTEIVQTLRREYSAFQLSNPLHGRTTYDELVSWFLAEPEVDRVLDAIELSFRFVEHACSHPSYALRNNNDEITRDAIEELNVRFKEHGVGYQYSDGQIVRVDSELVHKEVVVPALTVLRGKEYKNAQEEFLSAYEHFRHGKKQEALVDCYKCFESTMKVICTKRKWKFDPKAAAKDLVNVCLSNGLIPPYWQAHFNGLRSVLESAISTPRNKQAGHGAGAGPSPEIPEELVSYVLHMTAATVLFLAKADQAMGRS